MTAHPIAPMTDAELFCWEETSRRHQHGAGSDGIYARGILAIIARMRAAEARALPPARLMRTAEEVEGLEDGNLLIQWPRWINATSPTFTARKRGRWISLGDRNQELSWIVGATVVGPLPDVEPITDTAKEDAQ